MKRCMKIVVLFLLLTILPLSSYGQCLDGKCEIPQAFDYGGWRAAIEKPVNKHRPLKTWRYVKREGHYKSVVRVIGVEPNGHRKLGSGCVIRWGNRIVVITARHVIEGTKRILIKHRLRWIRCKGAGHDKKWDIAILEPENTEGLVPVQLASFKGPRLKAGDQVESCGYGGPEGQLGCNFGVVQQFTKPSRDRGNLYDWVEFSGYARQGDSGGPVFKNGKVVGVLWGTNGRIVQATQFGRLHVFCATVLGPKKEIVLAEERPVVSINRAGLFDCQPPRFLNRPPAQDQPPQVTVQADPRVGNSLASIDRKLDQVIINTAPTMEMEEEEKEDELNPALLVLIIIGGVILAFVLYFKNEKGV